MKNLGVLFLLIFCFSFVVSEVYEGSTEVEISTEEIDTVLISPSVQKGFSLNFFPFQFTGNAVAQKSCGQLGASKSYKQNQLSCQSKTNSCPKGFTNLGATYDCKSCCATSSANGGSSSSPPASSSKCDFGKSGSKEFGNRLNTQHMRTIWDRYGRTPNFYNRDCYAYYLVGGVQKFVNEKKSCGYQVSLKTTTNGNYEWCVVSWRK